jgi:hypothetical protein
MHRVVLCLDALLYRGLIVSEQYQRRWETKVHLPEETAVLMTDIITYFILTLLLHAVFPSRKSTF